MATRRRLDEDELQEALAGLPHWDGDTDRIRRAVHVPLDDVDELLRRVAVEEGALDHHAVVDVEDGDVTFTVWTHSAGAVTELDIELARRIDALLGGGPAA